MDELTNSNFHTKALGRWRHTGINRVLFERHGASIKISGIASPFTSGLKDNLLWVLLAFEVGLVHLLASLIP